MKKPASAGFSWGRRFFLPQYVRVLLRVHRAGCVFGLAAFAEHVQHVGDLGDFAAVVGSDDMRQCGRLALGENEALCTGFAGHDEMLWICHWICFPGDCLVGEDSMVGKMALKSN